MKNTGLILVIGAGFLLFMGGFITYMNPATPFVGLPTAVIAIVAFVLGLVYLVKKKEEHPEENDHFLLRDLEEDSPVVILNDEDQYV